MNVLERIGTAYPDHVEGWVRGGTEPAPVPISFYGDAVQVHIRDDHEDADSTAAYVVAGDHVFYLDGRLDAIQQVNRFEKLNLARKQVSEYVRFVFENVQDGRLKVVEHPNDMHWDEQALRSALAAERVEIANGQVHPIRVTDQGRKKFHVTLTGTFRDLLVQCELEVASDGSLSPLGKKPLTRDLPLKGHDED